MTRPDLSHDPKVPLMTFRLRELFTRMAGATLNATLDPEGFKAHLRLREDIVEAVLSAERERLLGMTPESVAVEAAKTLLTESPDFFVGLRQFGDARTHSHLTNSLVGRGGCGWDCAECRTILNASSRILRAALPVLTAPLAAKLAEVERDRDRMRKIVVALATEEPLTADDEMHLRALARAAVEGR